MSPSEKDLISRERIAQVLAVTPQAVNNWVNRHADFPRPVQHGPPNYFEVSRVAAWFDSRVIPSSRRIKGEENAGDTWGQRFRTQMRSVLPPAAERQPAHLLEQQLWEGIEQMLHDSDEPAKIEAIALSLLCIKGTEPTDWLALRQATAANIHDVISQAVREQPEDMARTFEDLLKASDKKACDPRLLQLIRLIGGTRNTHSFRYLLDRFATFHSKNRRPEEYLVPAELAQLMVGILEPDAGSRIHDPCCAAGSLLIAAAEHMTRNDRPADISGRAMTAKTWDWAAMNRSIKSAKMDLGSRPSGNPGQVEAGQNRFDIVLLNPPFNQDWSLPEANTQREWPYGQPAPSNSAFAWLQTAVEALIPGGYAAVIMPGSAAESLPERTMRQALVESGVVRCVITLPDRLFRETTTAVTVWIVTRPTIASTQDVLLIDGRTATELEDRNHRVLTERGCKDIIVMCHGWLKNAVPPEVDKVTATTVTPAELRTHNYNLAATNYLQHHPEVTPHPTGTLIRELKRSDAAARAADLVLDQRLRKVAPWTR